MNQGNEENLNGCRILTAIVALGLSLAVIPGTVYGGWQWSLGLGAGTRYDTNVQIASDGHPDAVYSVNSQVGMTYQGSKMNLTGSYGLGFELFQTYKNLNRASQSLSIDGDLSRMMGPVFPDNSTLHFSEMMVDAPFLPNFQSAVAPNPSVTTGGVSTPRTNTFLNFFSISESSPITARTGIQFSYQNTYTTYDDPALVDSLTNVFAIGLSHDLSRVDTVNGNVSYSRFDPHGGGPSFTYMLTVGEKHIFSEVMTGSVNLGAGAAVLPSSNHPDFISMGNMSLTRSLSEKLQLSVMGGRNFSTNNGGIANTVLITDSGTVSLSRQMSRFLSANVALNAARNYSLGSATSAGFHTDIHSQNVNVGLNYQFATWLNGHLSYNYTRQEEAGSTQGDLIQNQYIFALQGHWS
ncbi:MAG TPA: hypothetical protein VMN77_03475 [Nitrospiria bacterium]|nr:hypothetical protein [Nitrospiria bacterium]